MSTVIIFEGPHYPRDRRQINDCNPYQVSQLRRMAEKKNLPINVKGGQQ